MEYKDINKNNSILAEKSNILQQKQNIERDVTRLKEENNNLKTELEKIEQEESSNMQLFSSKIEEMKVQIEQFKETEETNENSEELINEISLQDQRIKELREQKAKSEKEFKDNYASIEDNNKKVQEEIEKIKNQEEFLKKNNENLMKESQHLKDEISKMNSRKLNLKSKDKLIFQTLGKFEIIGYTNHINNSSNQSKSDSFQNKNEYNTNIENSFSESSGSTGEISNKIQGNLIGKNTQNLNPFNVSKPSNPFVSKVSSLPFQGKKPELIQKTTNEIKKPDKNEQGNNPFLDSDESLVSKKDKDTTNSSFAGFFDEKKSKPLVKKNEAGIGSKQDNQTSTVI